MDEDDLPPRKEDRGEKSLGFVLGEGAGAIVWIALIFAAVGLLVYAAVEWLR